MRRIIFLLIIASLLLCSVLVSQVASRAATGISVLRVANLSFFYKQDEQARFLDLKTQWQTERRGELSLSKAAEFAQQAYDKASVEAELPEWRYHGGPSPKVITAKVHLYNSSKKALLNTPISMTLKAEVGDLRVSPQTQMTDYQYLASTAQWQTVASKKIIIPAIAPEEDQQLSVMTFHLMDFLATHNNQWPRRLKVTLSSPSFKTTEKQLTLIPDHFIVPVLY